MVEKSKSYRKTLTCGYSEEKMLKACVTLVL